MPLLPVVVPPDEPACPELGWEEGLPPHHPGRLNTRTHMATIYSRGGTWYINFRQGDRQVRVSLGTSDRKEAEALRAEKEAELRGLITPTRGVTIAQVLDEYLEWYKTARPHTFGRALSALKRFRAEFDSVTATRCSLTTAFVRGGLLPGLASS